MSGRKAKQTHRGVCYDNKDNPPTLTALPLRALRLMGDLLIIVYPIRWKKSTKLPRIHSDRTAQLDPLYGRIIQERLEFFRLAGIVVGKQQGIELLHVLL